MPNTNSQAGQFLWRELMCRGLPTAREFYGTLFGWCYDDVPSASGSYNVVKHHGRAIGGMRCLAPATKIEPHWRSYVCVEDVEHVARVAGDNGGRVLVFPHAVPELGVVTVLADPTGAAVTVFQNEWEELRPIRPSPIGTFCWETLHTVDAQRVKDFYGSVFGWRMIPGPSEGMILFQAGEVAVANVRPVSANLSPHWSTHVVVHRLDDVNERAARRGACVLMPILDLRHLGRLGAMRDPEGASLSLFEPAAGSMC